MKKIKINKFSMILIVFAVFFLISIVSAAVCCLNKYNEGDYCADVTEAACCPSAGSYYGTDGPIDEADCMDATPYYDSSLCANVTDCDVGCCCDGGTAKPTEWTRRDKCPPTYTFQTKNYIIDNIDTFANCDNSLCATLTVGTTTTTVPGATPTTTTIPTTTTTVVRVTTTTIQDTTTTTTPTQACNGCLKDSTCLPFGTRLKEENIQKFCNLDKTLKSQKAEDMTCNNNYECRSNLCVDNKCMSSGLINRIINWFKRLFGGSKPIIQPCVEEWEEKNLESGKDFKPGEIIVAFKEDIKEKEAKSIISSYDLVLEVMKSITVNNTYGKIFVSAGSEFEWICKLKENQKIVYINTNNI